MGRLVDHPERVFQVWSYGVGMSRLLLRSTKSDTFDARVDVLFQNVKALKLPTLLDGLTVAEADGSEVAQISRETGCLPDEETTLFVLRSPAYEGYVVAGVCLVAEDDGEYFEPSQLWQEP